MKKVLVAVALMMMLALGVMAQEAAKAKPGAKAHAEKMGAGGDVSQMLLDMENKMNDAMKAGDWETVGSMLDDKLVSVDESGVTDKAGWIKMMSGAKLSEATLSDMKAVPFGDTYIVSGKFAGKGTDAEGKALTLNVHWMDTWMKHGGKWKVVGTAGANAK